MELFSEGYKAKIKRAFYASSGVYKCVVKGQLAYAQEALDAVIGMEYDYTEERLEVIDKLSTYIKSKEYGFIS